MADSIGCGAAKHSFGSFIEKNNSLVRVYSENGVSRRLDDAGKLGLTLAEVFFHLPPCSDITHKRAERNCISATDWGNRNFNRELMAITMDCADLNAPVQHAGLATGQVTLQSAHVRITKTLGNNGLGQRPPERTLPRPSENSFRLRIPSSNYTRGVNSDNGVQSRLNDQTYPLFIGTKRRLCLDANCDLVF